jgi:drug/metabolite transporter (DMT)-like permease
MTEARPEHGRAWAAGMASVLAYGMVPVVAMFGLDDGVSPSVLVTLRGLFAMVGIGLLCALTGRLRAVPLRAIGWLVLVCGPLHGLQVFAFFASMQHGGAQTAIVVTHVYPVLVILLVSLRDRVAVSWRAGLLAVTALGGLAMVALTGGATFSRAAVGLALVCALGYALYLVGSERWVHRIDTVVATGLVTAGSTLSIGAVALAQHGSFTLSATAWQVTLLQGLLLPIGVCGALFAVRGMGSVAMALLGILEPVVGVLLAALVLHERMTVLQWIGGAVVLTACALVPLFASRRPNEQTGEKVREEPAISSVSA